MSEAKNDSFMKAFLPGLVLGIVIGAVAGATLPTLLGKPSAGPIKGTGKAGDRTAAERDSRTPVGPQKSDPQEDPDAPQGGQPDPDTPVQDPPEGAGGGR